RGFFRLLDPRALIVELLRFAPCREDLGQGIERRSIEEPIVEPGAESLRREVFVLHRVRTRPTLDHRDLCLRSRPYRGPKPRPPRGLFEGLRAHRVVASTMLLRELEDHIDRLRVIALRFELVVLFL